MQEDVTGGQRLGNFAGAATGPSESHILQTTTLTMDEDGRGDLLDKWSEHLGENRVVCNYEQDGKLKYSRLQNLWRSGTSAPAHQNLTAY